MNIFIALFRGINVGGNHIIPMKVLSNILENIGLQDVRTYIQSGNVVFRSGDSDVSPLEDKIGSAVLSECGFKPAVQLVTLEELDRAIVANPYKDAESEPKSLHLFFLASEPVDLDTATLDDQKSATESYLVIGKVMYLHAPDGVGRSKIASKAERLVGVQLTARNWRTVSKIAEIARETGA